MISSWKLNKGALENSVCKIPDVFIANRVPKIFKISIYILKPL